MFHDELVIQMNSKQTEKRDICLFYQKILAKCPIFETIKRNDPVLKLDFLKIESQLKLDFWTIKL